MSRDTETAPDDESGAAEGDDENPRDPSPPTTIQNKAPSGSYSHDDPDRPLWDSATTIEAKFRYCDANGRDAYFVFKGQRPDGEKVFVIGRRIDNSNDLQIAKAEDPRAFYNYPGLTLILKGKGDAPDLLYALDKLTAATAADDGSVFIVEGEKDADTLIALGLNATTNPNGALNWKDEFNSYFADRDVVIMVDNDDRGRQRARTIYAALAPVARSIKVIELPGLPEHGDVTDWLEAGNTKGDLLAIVEESPPVTGGTWISEADDFNRDQNDIPYRSPPNARRALQMLGVSVSYDTFANRYLLSGLEGFGPALDDAALTRLRLSIEERFLLAFAKERFCDIVLDHARDNSCHPVCEYLDGLTWDGIERLDRWLHEYGGAEDSEYVRSVGAICLIAAVRRVRKPGCKYDEMLVLESSQGTNKSTALGVLAVRDDWFTDDVPLDADSKVLMERIAGCWLAELAELKGMKRGEIEHVKSMLSRRIDKARLAYGRMTTEQPRQSIFIGTTNDHEYLRDMTGNRRFWPVKVSQFDIKRLRADRDQLWAEAAMREADGEPIRLPENLWSAAGLQQSQREVREPWHELLSERLDGLEGKIRASDIWEAVGLGDAGKRTQDHNVRLSSAMQKIGWRRPKSKLRFGGPPQHAWVKGDEGASVSAFEEVPRRVVLGQTDQGDNGRPM
ncbi:VapE domain-containing protein [uncultured Parasphingopyxis sp.]|uniref:VapE domain-containing protein n=1 Tax=uncultured Parasphingopyxis sp. TaxID=1547918 RepID=UPI00260EC8C1|nr:VapE domain-containing protein [uncultured Parasphingopyxis sp.]